MGWVGELLCFMCSISKVLGSPEISADTEGSESITKDLISLLISVNTRLIVMESLPISYHDEEEFVPLRFI